MFTPLLPVRNAVFLFSRLFEMFFLPIFGTSIAFSLE